MESVTSELEAGIAAARAGAKDQARACFLRVLQADPRNETAWLWLSGVMPTTEEALRCVEHLLAINPNHARAKEAQELLRVRLLVEEAAIFKDPTPPPARPPRRYLLGEVLVEAGVISPGQLEQVLQYQASLARKKKLLRKQKPLRLGEILVRYGLVRPEQLEAALGVQIESISSTAPATAVGHFGNYLVQQGLITPDQLQRGLGRQAELRQRGQEVPLGDILVQLGYLQRAQLTRALLQWQQDFELAFR